MSPQFLPDTTEPVDVRRAPTGSVNPAAQDGPALTDAVLIIGGAGFIGTATCTALAAKGIRATVADIALDAMHPEYVTLDISDSAAVNALFDQLRPRIVINLAYSLADASQRQLDRAFRVNVVGSQNVMEACRRVRVQRYLYASSIAVYGDQTGWGDRVLTELDRGQPVRLYGWYKVLQEELAAEYGRQFGMSCVGLRISTVYGAGRHVGLSAGVGDLTQPIRGARIRCEWESGESFDLVHVEDVANAFVALATACGPLEPVYNTGGEYVTVGWLLDRLRVLRPDVHIEQVQPPSTFKHCSRIDWTRLRALMPQNRIPIAARLVTSAGNIDHGG